MIQEANEVNMLRWRDRGKERLDWRNRHGELAKLQIPNLKTDLILHLIVFSI